MERQGNKWRMAFLGICLLLAGCATIGPEQQWSAKVIETNMVDVKLNVNLERPFVQAHSKISALATILYTGPFQWSDNTIALYGAISEKSEGKVTAVGSFLKELKWGDNSFNIKVPKNSEVRFELRYGGNRYGVTDIGSAEIGSEPTQTVTINLTANGSKIE